jgi:eukaryotic-like serine/threonine-protein kinase
VLEEIDASRGPVVIHWDRMDVAELQRRVDRVAKLDLRPLYDTYLAEAGAAASREGFLAFLGRTRAVDIALLKELHATSDVEITRATDAAAFAATLGGAGPPRVRNPGDMTVPGGSQAVVARNPGTMTMTRFEPIAKLGEGAMGSVSIARDVHLRRKVALKTVLPEMTRSAEVMSRFVAEMQVTAQLDHPNIVPVYGLEATDGGSVGYAMKLVRGVDLEVLIKEAHDLLEAGKPLDADHQLEKRLEHFLKVCDAVEFAHAKGIIHRDLKPANVMIGSHNEVYLMDWGVARLMGSGDKAFEAGIVVGDQDQPRATDPTRTIVGATIGTPSYMSPEQAAGRHTDLDSRSDQYALGLILQECVTLAQAVTGTSLPQVLSKALLAKRDPPPQGKGYPPMPREIAAIVDRSTQLDPAKRYPSVRALADDVRRFLSGEPVSVLPEGGLRKAGRWLARHRMTTVAIVLGLAFTGAVATIGSLVLGQARVQAAHARELRVRELQAQSAIEAQLVAHELARYEAALTKFVGAAQIALVRAPPGSTDDGAGWQRAYFEDAFTGKAEAPPDLAPAGRYGKPVSVLVPVSSLAAGADDGESAPVLRSLGWLAPAFSRMFIESSGADPYRMTPEQRRAAIAEQGVPALRAVVALKDGVTLAYPGMAAGALADERVQASLKLVFGTTGVKWGTAIVGPSGSILPASAALYDDAGVFRGVVVLDVSLDRLLAPPGVTKLGYVQSRYLVGRDGKIVSEDSPSGKRAPLAKEVVGAIARGESGTRAHDVDGRPWQYAYYPLANLDWYYVAVSEVDQMVSSKEKVETSDPRQVVKAAATAAATSGRRPAAPPPTPTPPPAGTEAATAVDAGADQDDRGADPSASATADDAGARPAPWPTARKNPPRPTAAPSSDALPPNPFEPWKVYRKPKKK